MILFFPSAPVLFERNSSSIPCERTFSRLYSFLKVLFWYRLLKPIFIFFYCVCEYKSFNKIGLMVINSARLMVINSAR